MAQPLSTFTFRALFDALQWMEPRQTALLRGRHGIGKSAVAYQMAERWGLTRVIERRISQLSEGDMIGLPDRGAVKEFDGEKWNVTSFLPTDWFLEAMFTPCLIFLDEINRGTPETMQACFQFVEKGELNGRKIHPDSRIIAAINHSKEYQVASMDPAFVDRFWVADVEPDREDWVSWARGRGKISEDVIDFIVQCNEDHFEIMPEKAANLPSTEITPSRRSWERLNNHITKQMNGTSLIEMPNSKVFYDVCRGFVGPDASRALSKFLGERDRNITPDNVLNEFDKYLPSIKKLKPEQHVALIDKLKSSMKSANKDITDEQAMNLSKFMKAIPAEIGITLWSAVSGTTLQNATKFHKYIAKHFIASIAQTKLGNDLPHLKNIKTK